MASKVDELKEEHRPCSSDQSTNNNNAEEDPNPILNKRTVSENQELSKQKSSDRNENSYKEYDSKK